MLDAESMADGLARAIPAAAEAGDNVVVHIGSSTVEINPKRRVSSVVETSATAPDMAAINGAMERAVAYQQVRQVLAVQGIVDETILRAMSDADLAERLRRAFAY
ncbi:hypothetical protein [Rathayibacter festucae]|uniref:Uncharacterized protein n=1 Tax=Rathayibacter festucae DSM 15932 TaxID=1328866 RepID=A0A3T0T2P8_9MICO|nr:hypothetical protein [Rathayibacter festucae]AZZ52810.1 hypothetical protein C1I64_12670 [Rathayibacter festucae DSM 15932]